MMKGHCAGRRRRPHPGPLPPPRAWRGKVRAPSSVTLEVLDRLFVLLRGGERLERAEVLALSGLRVLLPGVEAVFAGLQLADHDGGRCKSRTSTRPARVRESR